MENKIDKKKLTYTIIGIITLILLIIGATYAYFMGSNSAYGTTEAQTELGEAVSIALSNPTDEMHLRLTASDMTVVKAGTSYYLTSDDSLNYVSNIENNVVSRLSVVGNSETQTYTCTYNLNVVKPSGINAGDMSLILTANGATIDGVTSGSEIDLATASSSYTISFTHTGPTDGKDLLSASVKLNNTLGDQNHLAGKSLSVQFSNGELSCTSEVVTETSICSLASDSTVAAGEYGAKYNCKVDPNKDAYTFYLIDNNEDGTSDLIMNANINASGEVVIPGVTSDIGLVEWQISGNNTDGPVTAMTYLYNATKSWTNVEPVNYEYFDKEVQASEYGYISFRSFNGIATITKGDTDGTQVTIGTTSEPLRSRMPIYSSNVNITESFDKTDETMFTYNNLDANWEYSGPYGYWTMSTYSSNDSNAWNVYGGGTTVGNGDSVASASVNGVRPIISVIL